MILKNTFTFFKIYQAKEKKCLIIKANDNSSQTIYDLIAEARKDVPSVCLSELRIINLLDEKKRAYKGIEFLKDNHIPQGYFINHN